MITHGFIMENDSSEDYDDVRQTECGVMQVLIIIYNKNINTIL
jgi:hypothetical protein